VRCGCGGEYPGHGSCRDRTLIKTAADALSVLQQRVEQLEQQVRELEDNREFSRQGLEAAERERDEFKTLANIGIWHDDCRPNRHMAARELAKSQAIIDKLADTVSTLTREKEAAEHRELQLRSAIAGIGEHQAKLDHLTIVKLAMSQRDRLEAAEATIASITADRDHWKRTAELWRVQCSEDRATLASLRKLAKEATNGWACFAKRKNELDEIGRIHAAIDAVKG